jgi:hypothetical protein
MRLPVLLLALVAQADGGQELTDEMMDEALASNKDYVRLAVSGLICHADIVRMVGLKQIADEKEASKIGGVVNMKTAPRCSARPSSRPGCTDGLRPTAPCVKLHVHLQAPECPGDVAVLLKCWARTATPRRAAIAKARSARIRRNSESVRAGLNRENGMLSKCAECGRDGSTKAIPLARGAALPGAAPALSFAAAAAPGAVDATGKQWPRSSAGSLAILLDWPWAAA